MILFVTFGLSGHSQLLCSDEPQFWQRGPSVSRNVPFNWANSRNCIRRRSLCPSGTSMPCLITSLIFSTAFFTQSRFAAVINACSGSSSPGNGCPSFRPTFPSLTEPFPRMMILAPVSFSIAFNVFPRGPINSPTKLMSGCSSCGISTLSLTRITGALFKWHKRNEQLKNSIQAGDCICVRRNLLVIRRRFEFRIHALHAQNQLMPLLFQTFTRTKFARVQTLTIRAVDRFG